MSRRRKVHTSYVLLYFFFCSSRCYSQSWSHSHHTSCVICQVIYLRHVISRCSVAGTSLVAPLPLSIERCRCQRWTSNDVTWTELTDRKSVISTNLKYMGSSQSQNKPLPSLWSPARSMQTVRIRCTNTTLTKSVKFAHKSCLRFVKRGPLQTFSHNNCWLLSQWIYNVTIIINYWNKFVWFHIKT